MFALKTKIITKRNLVKVVAVIVSLLFPSCAGSAPATSAESINSSGSQNIPTDAQIETSTYQNDITPNIMPTGYFDDVVGIFRVKADKVVGYDTATGELAYQAAGGHHADEYFEFTHDGRYTSNAYGAYVSGAWSIDGTTITYTPDNTNHVFETEYDPKEKTIGIMDISGAGGFCVTLFLYYKDQPVTYSWAIEPTLDYDVIAYEPKSGKFIGIYNSNDGGQQFVINRKTGASTDEALPDDMKSLMTNDENRTDISTYTTVRGTLKNGKWVFIDDKGFQTVSYEFDGIVSADYQMAFVKYNGKWGIIRKW